MAERAGAKRSSGGAKKATRSAAARKGGQARGRQQRAQKAAKTTARAATKPASGAGVEAKTVAELREALRKNLIKPTGMVMLSRDRIEEALDKAVKNGEITAKGAREVTRELLDRGKRQTDAVLKDLEGLLGRGRGEIESRTSGVRKAAGGAAKGARKQAAGARSRATRAAAPALAQADRVRRGAGVGSNFPITRYDDLNATQVVSRLRDLTPAQLRKVRDRERRGAGRKTILNAIESRLG